MNPPPTPPEEGSQCRGTLASSPPGRGQGWVGSWGGKGEGKFLFEVSLILDRGAGLVSAAACVLGSEHGSDRLGQSQRRRVAGEADLPAWPEAGRHRGPATHSAASRRALSKRSGF